MTSPAGDASPRLMSYRSSDPDRIESFWVDQVKARVSFDRSSTASVPFTFSSASLGPVTLGSHQPHLDFRIHDEQDNFYLLATARTGYTGYRQRGVEYLTGPGRAVVYGPGNGPPEVRSGGGSRLSWLRVDSWALERHLEALLGRPVGGHLGLAPYVDLNRDDGRMFHRLFGFLIEQVGASGGLLNEPLIAGRLYEAALTGLLLATDYPFRDALTTPARPAPTRSVRTAMDAIHAQPERAYTAADLAALTGGSVRSLQAGFRSHLGVSPMAYLREVRLIRAHRDLQADPTASVAQVAFRWGFTHLGRFAAAYANRYGSSPSETRRVG